MVMYHDNGSLGGMIVLHVDDIVIATDGTDEIEAKVETLREKYPFGEWVDVAECPDGITYTGRTIKIVGNEVHLDQQEFVDGRMDDVAVKRVRGRDGKDPCNATEHAEYRSGVGNLHWATSQTRVDHAIDTSKLQKKQNKPTYEDLKNLSKIVKEVK